VPFFLGETAYVDWHEGTKFGRILADKLALYCSQKHLREIIWKVSL
jgi:hypothetical protein